jgi:uncharacterized SAM-binding protein YcdF (DUF218 family)
MSFLLSMAGRLLTQPLFVLLTIAIFTTAVALMKAKRWLLSIAVGSLVFLWLLATPAVAHALESMLAIEPSPVSQLPDVIEIPGGGYISGAEPHLDMLSGSTRERVIEGVTWWRTVRAPRVVMAGADTMMDGSTSTRALELMREAAIQEGVPPAVITMEGRSGNTLEHPVELAKLPGISRATKVGIVTSCIHERRAAREFRRHFDTVILHPVPCYPLALKPLYGTIFPSPGPLERSTRAIHEIAGTAWYAVRRLPGR